MTDAISSANVSTVKLPDVRTETKVPPAKVKDLPPDSFESNKKTSLASVTLATGASITAGVGAYKGVKNLMGKALGGIEKEVGEFTKGIGKEVSKLPNKVKTIATFGAAGVAALGAAILAFKDSDGNGKLDIVDSVNRFFN